MEEINNNLNICVLCMFHQNIPNNVIKTANETWIKHCRENNIDVYKCISTNYNKIENNIIYCDCKDGLEYTYDKTILAIKQLDYNKYDFIIHTKFSTYINCKALIEYCKFLKENNYQFACGDLSICTSKMLFTGNSHIYSKELVEFLINPKNYYDNTYTLFYGDIIINKIINENINKINIHQAPIRWYVTDPNYSYYNHPKAIHNINENIDGIVFIINRDRQETFVDRSKECQRCLEIEKYYDNLTYKFNDIDQKIIWNLTTHQFEYIENISEYIKTNLKPSNLKVLLVTMVKQENLYLQEFINYYRSIGFTNIALYDNNDKDGEILNIKNNEDGFVIIENRRGIPSYMKRCYTEAYNKYKNDYDWIAFFDADEYLRFPMNGYMPLTSIKDYLDLNVFNNYDCIKINWQNFGDDDIEKVKNNNYSITRFKNPLPIDFKIDNEYPYNYHTKSIVRCIDKHIIFKSTHIPENIDPNKYCNNCGKPSSRFPIHQTDYSFARLDHYYTKTIDEFIKKISRGLCDFTLTNINVSYYEIKYRFSIFERLNKITPYKEKRIKETLKLFENNKINASNVLLFNISDNHNSNINKYNKYKNQLGNFYNIYDLKDVELNDFICLHNNDIKFDFNKEDIYEKIQTNEICLKEPHIYNNSIFNKFNEKYDNKDLLVIGAIIKKYYENYLYDYNLVLMNNKLYLPIFILNKKTFILLMNFIYDIIDKFIEYKEKHNEEILSDLEEICVILFNIYINTEMYMLFIQPI